MAHPTILDVAKQAYVSRSTAALALSGRADKVSPETRDRVIAAATALGYRPNPAGNALRKGSGGEIAFVYHELSEFEMEYGAGQMWARFAMRLGMDLGKAGYRLLMLSKSELGADPLATTGVLAFAEPDGRVLLPQLPFGTPVWVASAGDTGGPFARITHDFPLIARQVVNYVCDGDVPEEAPISRIVMCIRAVEDPPFTYAMEEALHELLATTNIELTTVRIDPRQSAEDTSRALDLDTNTDAILCWGVAPARAPQMAEAIACPPKIVAFCENELPNDFSADTAHVSFRIDDAAQQIAAAIVETIGGVPHRDVTLSHTFSHANHD
ncbi:MAG: LacI family DNA-binding transcriptional regulator [Actinobacteria bacterium]|nr:LacI family DNA-binding transcriptional regulator [Actinomycetota bacterium]